MTVIEVARRAAGLSQTTLARRARTRQSAVSEYERRRKSPTLEVVERLVDAADAELVVRPLVLWDDLEDDELGTVIFPDRLWSVPIPDCFARVQVLKNIFKTADHEIWDLSITEERIAYYELVLVRGTHDMIEDSVDGALLVQAWPHLQIPEVTRAAWQPAIDAAVGAPDRRPRDPAGFSAQIAGMVGMRWPPRAKRKSRRTTRR